MCIFIPKASRLICITLETKSNSVNCYGLGIEIVSLVMRPYFWDCFEVLIKLKAFPLKLVFARPVRLQCHSFLPVFLKENLFYLKTNFLIVIWGIPFFAAKHYVSRLSKTIILKKGCRSKNLSQFKLIFLGAMA